MSEAKHTPTPWSMTIDAQSRDYTISGADGETIANDTCYYPSAPNEADALFIVKAVNNHDDLLAALKLARSTIDHLYEGFLHNSEAGCEAWDDASGFDVCRTLDAAIAKEKQP